jgi:hypothetical protein
MPDQPSLRQAGFAANILVLPADLASGPDFHVSEPVESDGLMHHGFLQRRTSNARLGY